MLCETDPDYVSRLENLDEDTKKAMLYGDWDSFAGQYFKEWRKDIHVVKPFAIPKEWRRIIALDYGNTNPSAVLWLAIDPDDNIYCYRELYITRKRYGELLDEIRMMTSPDEEILALVADPALQAKAPDTGLSFFDIAKTKKFNIIPGVNDRIPGWNTIRELLHVVEDEKLGGIAKLRVFSTCANLIRTLPQLIYDAVKVEDCDTNGEDHAPDALRYGCMFLAKRRTSLAALKKVNDERPTA